GRGAIVSICRCVRPNVAEGVGQKGEAHNRDMRTAERQSSKRPPCPASLRGTTRRARVARPDSRTHTRVRPEYREMSWHTLRGRERRVSRSFVRSSKTQLASEDWLLERNSPIANTPSRPAAREANRGGSQTESSPQFWSA